MVSILTAIKLASVVIDEAIPTLDATSPYNFIPSISNLHAKVDPTMPLGEHV